MHVRHLSLVDYRNYASVAVDLEPGASVFVGANGQGKTNLVEALVYVATLGSHRVAADAPLVRVGAERAVVRVAVVSGSRELLVELEIVPGKANRARLNRSPASRPRDILGALRAVLFAPEDLALVRGDPAERRRFLDELLVARSPRFAAVRADYERVLKQRNALLRTASLARRAAKAGGADLRTLDVWDGHLAAHGAELLAGRSEVLAALTPHVEKAYDAVSAGGGPARLAYRSSLAEPGDSPESRKALPESPREALPESPDSPRDASPEFRQDPSPDTGAAPPPRTDDGQSEVLPSGETTLSPTSRWTRREDSAPPDREALTARMLAALARVRSAEVERGVTLVGPHRDDVVLSLGDLPAKGYASHGEAWSLALALRLASYELLASDGGEPVLILDDVFAELDTARRDRLAGLVADATQLLVTAAVPVDVPAVLRGARYDVAAGEVRRVR